MVNRFEDVRNTIYSKQDGVIDTPSEDILQTLTYNESTKWSDPTVPQLFMEKGKDPKLGIKDLHKNGITGKGVNVAIIDQPLALDHPEYKGKIIYKTFFPENTKVDISSHHGPAVASLLAGESIGVAPGVVVYYAAVPQWLRNSLYEVKALKWIMSVNEQLEENSKIKFVSVSAAPGDETNRDHNRDLWKQTVKEAHKRGILVIDCQSFVSRGFLEYSSQKFYYGTPGNEYENIDCDVVYVPTSLRTIAESYDNKTFSYTYSGVGGLSWGIPYAVGVLCLGQQVNNHLTPEELKARLIICANKNRGVIAPKNFIDSVINN